MKSIVHGRKLVYIMFDVYRNGRTVVHLEKLRRFEGYNLAVLSDFLSGGRRKSVRVFVI